MKKSFVKCKWISLMSFSVMYSLVYLGRFSVNNMMDQISVDFMMSDTQQYIVSVSVFISYAVGSFINGYLADRYGAKKMIIIGGIMTCLLNAGIIVQTEWSGLLLICFINGYFQSMIWVGGISMLSHWWKEGERGQGVGIANFFSGMSHAVAFVLPIMILSLFPGLGWHYGILITMGILMIFVILFGIFAVERPERVGLEPYEAESESQITDEAYLKQLAEEGRRPWGYFLSKPKFWCWCIIAMLSSVCRYGLLNWIPMYYSSDGDSILSDTFSNLMLPVGMAFGTLIITWIAGTKLFDNKGIIITAMAALCGTLVIVFPMVSDIQTVLVGIFFTGFALYGINGILWVHAIDQGCRYFTGSAAGILNGFAYLGAFLEGILFPAVLGTFDSFLAVFVLMEILCIFMVIFGMVVSRKNTIVEPEVRE